MKYHNHFWPDEQEMQLVMAPLMGGVMLGGILCEKCKFLNHVVGFGFGMMLGAILGITTGIFVLKHARKSRCNKERPMILNIKGKLIEFSREEIASHDTDPQNGFTPLCPGELPVPEGDQIVRELNAQSKFAGIRTCSKDAHNPHAIHIATPENPQFKTIENHPDLDMYWNMHCQAGTYGAQLVDGLPGVLDYDFMVYKGIENDLHPYGACFHDTHKVLSTGLIEFYRHKGVNLVIVGGLATDYCVLQTVLQLRAAKFAVIVNVAACRGVAPATTEAALQQMGRAGAILVSSARAIESLIYKG